MQLIKSFFQDHPEAAIFLAIALGVVLGRVKIGSFSLGNATAVLIVATFLGATIAGPFALTYPPMLKTVAFALFVFAVGFHAGPQFFGSLGFATLTQVALAVFVAVVGLASALTATHLLGLDKGSAAGLAAGALTQTALIGTALSALGGLGLSPEALTQAQSNATVSYALTYIFGTAGVIGFVSLVAPRLMGVSLKEEARKLETNLAGNSVKMQSNALSYRPFSVRVYRVGRGAGQSVAQAEAAIGGRAVIRSIRPRRRRVGADALNSRATCGRRDRRDGRAAPESPCGRHCVIGEELEGQDLLAPAEGTQDLGVVLTRRETLPGQMLEDIVAKSGDSTQWAASTSSLSCAAARARRSRRAFV